MASNWNKNQDLNKFKIPKGINFGNKPPSKSWSVKAAKEPPDSLVPPNALEKLVSGEQRQKGFKTRDFGPDDKNYNAKGEYPRYLRSLELQPYAITQEFIDNRPYDVYYYKSQRGDSPQPEGWKVIVPSNSYLTLDAAIEKETYEYRQAQQEGSVLPLPKRQKSQLTKTLPQIAKEQRTLAKVEGVTMPQYIQNERYKVTDLQQITPFERERVKEVIEYEPLVRRELENVEELPIDETPEETPSSQVRAIDQYTPPDPEDCIALALESRSTETDSNGNVITYFVLPDEIDVIRQTFICRDGKCKVQRYYIVSVPDVLDLLEQGIAIEGNPEGRIVWPNSNNSPCDGVINEAVGYSLGFYKREEIINPTLAYDLMGEYPKFSEQSAFSKKFYELAPSYEMSTHLWGPVINLDTGTRGFTRHIVEGDYLTIEKDLIDENTPFDYIGKRYYNRYVKMKWGDSTKDEFETVRTPLGVLIEQADVEFTHAWTWQVRNGYSAPEEKLVDPDFDYNAHLASGIGIPFYTEGWTSHTITIGEETRTFTFDYEGAYGIYGYGDINHLRVNWSGNTLEITNKWNSTDQSTWAIDYNYISPTKTLPTGFTETKSYSNVPQQTVLGGMHPLMSLGFTADLWGTPTWPLTSAASRAQTSTQTHYCVRYMRWAYSHTTQGGIVRNPDDLNDTETYSDPVTYLYIYQGGSTFSNWFYILNGHVVPEITGKTYTNASFTRTASLVTTLPAKGLMVKGIVNWYDEAPYLYRHDMRHKIELDSFSQGFIENTALSYDGVVYETANSFDIDNDTKLMTFVASGGAPLSNATVGSVQLADNDIAYDIPRRWNLSGSFQQNDDHQDFLFYCVYTDVFMAKDLVTMEHPRIRAELRTNAAFTYETKYNRVLMRRYRPDDTLVLTEINGFEVSAEGVPIDPLAPEFASPDIWYSPDAAKIIVTYNIYERLMDAADAAEQSIFDNAEFLKTEMLLECTNGPIKYSFTRNTAYVSMTGWANHPPNFDDPVTIREDKTWFNLPATEVTISRPASGYDGNEISYYIVGELIESSEDVPNPLFSHVITILDYPVNGLGTEENPYEMALINTGDYIPEKIEVRGLIDAGLGPIMSDWIEVTPELEGLELLQNGILGDGLPTVEIRFNAPEVDPETGLLVLDEQGNQNIVEYLYYSDAPPIRIQRRTRMDATSKLVLPHEIQTPVIENQPPYDFNHVSGTGIGVATLNPDNPDYGGLFEVWLYYQSGGFEFFTINGLQDISVVNELNVYEGGLDTAEPAFTMEYLTKPTEFKVYGYKYTEEDVYIEFENNVSMVQEDFNVPGEVTVSWDKINYNLVDIFQGTNAVVEDTGKIGHRYQGTYSIARIPCYKPGSTWANEDGYTFENMGIVAINGVDPQYRISFSYGAADFFRIKTEIFVVGVGTPIKDGYGNMQFGESQWWEVASYAITNYADRLQTLPESYTDPSTGITWYNGGPIPPAAISPVEEEEFDCNLYKIYRAYSSNYVADPSAALRQAIENGSGSVTTETGDTIPTGKLADNFDNTYIYDIDEQIANAQILGVDYIVARDGTPVPISEVESTVDPFVNEWILDLSDKVTSATDSGSNTVKTRNGKNVIISTMISGYNTDKYFERGSYSVPVVRNENTRFKLKITPSGQDPVYYVSPEGEDNFLYDANVPVRLHDHYVYLIPHEGMYVNTFHPRQDWINQDPNNENTYIITSIYFSSLQLRRSVSAPRKWMEGWNMTYNNTFTGRARYSLVLFTHDMQVGPDPNNAFPSVRLDRFFHCYDWMEPVLTLNEITKGSENVTYNAETGEYDITHRFRVYEQSEENFNVLQKIKNKELSIDYSQAIDGQRYFPTELIVDKVLPHDPRTKLQIIYGEGIRYWLRIVYNSINLTDETMYENFDPTSDPDLFFIEQLPYLMIESQGQEPQEGDPGTRTLLPVQTRRCINNQYLNVFIDSIEVINEQPEQ